MKKKLLAGLVTGLYCLSACMMYTSTTTAYAIATGPSYDAPWTDWKKELDDKGMLRFSAAEDWWNGCYDDYSVFLCTGKNAYGETYESARLVARFRYEFGFELKQGQDVRTAAFKIVARYYPEYEKYVHSTGVRPTGSRDFSVRDTDEQRLAENAEAIKQELLAAGLISKFYDVGQIGKIHNPPCHYPCSYWAGGDGNPEIIQAYIDTAGFDCTLQYCEDFYPDGYPLSTPAYCVVPNNGEWSYEENFEVAASIYEALGIYSWTWIDTRASESTSYIFGQNALECPGDLNIDGEVDVSDAVLLARIVAEDDTMPAICDTGYINADVDGDGLLTILDVTALLETIAN